jgi:pyrimidine oxygenase
MDLGIFLPVANNGWILSSSAPADPPTFDLNTWIAQEAERRGFHFLLAQSVWRGHGGETRFWDDSLEGFTLMSALAAVTSRIGLVASCQPLLYHPVVAAKMVATASDISNGRFGINIVAGGNLSEAEQMGLLLDDWGTIRYDYAEEWMTAVESLWTEDRTTIDGQWIHLTDTVSGPKPRRSPPIIAAGASAKGSAFASKHATHAFIGAKDLPSLAGVNDRYKQAARDLGREISTYTTMFVHLEDTDAAASAYRQRMLDNPDLGAIADLVGQYSRPGAGESLRKEAEYDPADHVFFGGFTSTTAEGVAQKLRDLEATGVDGVLLSFSEWGDDLPRFAEEVLPLVPGMFRDADAEWPRAQGL